MADDQQPLLTLDDGEDTDSANKIPPLAEGMKYHLFISHSNDSEEEVVWAERVVHTMEEEYGYKCMLPSRDFTPGHDIPTLIQNGIASSMKIVCVLTPDSLNSGWCKIERDMAFVLSVQENKNRIIPLLLKECEVPNIFKTLNYIDVPKGEDYIHRIQRSFDEHREMPTIIPNIEQIVQELDNLRQSLNTKDTVNGTGNGHQFRISGQKVMSRGTAWSFGELNLHQRDRLNELKSPDREDVYVKVKKIANQTPHLRYYTLTNSMCRGLCIFLLLYMTIVFSVILIILIVEILQSKLIISGNSVHSFIIVFPLLFAVGAVVCVAMVLTNILTFRAAKERILNFSLQQVMKTNILVNYEHNTFGPPIIQLMSYDVRPCVVYLSEFFLKKTTALEECNEEEKEEARRKAEAALMTFLRQKNDAIFKWNGLQATLARRHRTIQGKACLCEMITGS